MIVVDSGSQPPCRELVERHAPRLPRLRYLYEPRPGLARARNRGLRAAACALVAFVDDDAAVAPDWARRLAAPFADDRVACVGGACRPAFAVPPPRWLSERLLQYAGITRFGSAAREAVRTSDYPFGANVAFRRDALLAARAFPEQLGRIGSALLSGEEAAAIDALRGAGWRVRLEPAAVVAHTVAAERCSSRYYWRRLFWQGVTRARAGASPRLTLRLLAALPVRVCLFALTRDRVHLYRTAETAGYLRELLAR